MYFILSKVLFFILVPLNWVFVLFIIAFIKRRKPIGRRFAFAGVIVLYIFTIPLLFKGFARLWDVDSAPSKNSNKKYSCVIVLGGFAGSDANGNGRFTWAADRFITGMQRVKTGKAANILISGGNGSLIPGGFREARWAKQQLLQLGVADSLILTEDRSRNTLENAEFSKVVLDSNRLKPPYLLVTSAFHMRRAKMIFNKKGLNVVAVSCSYLIGNDSYHVTDLLPQADVIGNWDFYTKEVVGYMVNYFG